MNIIEKLVKRIISRHAWKKFIKETVEKQKTCAGCKHLAYWNNGSPFCNKGIDHACIQSGFKFYE